MGYSSRDNYLLGCMSTHKELKFAVCTEVNTKTYRVLSNNFGQTLPGATLIQVTSQDLLWWTGGISTSSYSNETLIHDLRHSKFMKVT